MPTLPHRSFTSGEISPSLQSRTDTVKYATGLSKCQNFIVKPQGGVYSRPGLRFIGELDDSLSPGRLIDFSFNTEQTYVLAFEHLKMRVIRNGGLVLAGGGPAVFELTTPYTESQLSRLGYTQSADVMTIVHPDHDPMNLSRLADDNWVLSTIIYTPTIAPPVFPVATVKSITGVALSNPCSVEILSHGFTTGSVITVDGIDGTAELNGRSFRLTVIDINYVSLDDENATTYTAYVSGGTATHKNDINTVGEGFGTYNKTYSYVVTSISTDGSESLASDSVSIDTSSLSATGGVRLVWNTVATAEYYRVYKDPSGDSGFYGWVGDTLVNAFSDFNTAPITSDAPPNDRQPFTGVGNKPSTVEYYQQRQIFANTLVEPQVVLTTQTGNFISFRTSSPARDDDAVTFTINARKVNEVRHLISLDALVMLTSGGEWISSEGQDRVMTPSTIGARVQSVNGSSWVKPVVVNDTALYVQEKGGRVRDLSYEFSSDKYAGNDLSIMSEHLFEDHQIIEMSHAAEPHGVVWCIRDDGVMLGLTYQREHQVFGWHQHITDGEFESVTSVSEEGRDAVYVIVKRVVNGVTKRYIERMEKRESLSSEDAFCVDSGLSYVGTPATIITGLSHLEGKDVDVLADGHVVKGHTVVNGRITLARPASKIHIGIQYLPVIETLDMDTPGETLKPHSISVSRVTIEVEKSRGGFVGPKQDATSTQPVMFEEIKPRFDSDGYNPIKLKTYKQQVHVQPQWSKGGGLRIEQRSPLPLAILAVMPEFDLGG